MVYKLITAPTTLPVSLADVKSHLNIEHEYTGDDLMLLSMITSATSVIENALQGPLMPQTWMAFDSDFSDVNIEKNPVTGITVKYYDTSGVLQTVSSSNYQVNFDSRPAKLSFNSDFTFPDVYDRIDAFQVTIECGYDEVPGDLIMWVKVLITNFYEHRDFSVKPELIELIRNNIMVHSAWL